MGQRLLDRWRHSFSGQIEFCATRSAQEAVELALNAPHRNYRGVIAVGGDGTLSLLGGALVERKFPLAVVPIGSGNGIARHFGISMNPSAALQQALNGKVKTIDTLEVAGNTAIGWVGIGFDAAVARAFDKGRTRGFSTYTRIAMNMAAKYKPNTYTVDQSTKARFAMVAANTSQFGNEAYMNPGANAEDGQFEWLEIASIPALAMPALAARLFAKSIHTSKFVSRESRRSVFIQCETPMDIQIDGEVGPNLSEVSITINPKSLQIIVP